MSVVVDFPPVRLDSRRDPSGLHAYAECLRRCHDDVHEARALFEFDTGEGCPFGAVWKDTDAANIDFETRSEVDLGDCGAHVYAADPSTRILCMAWAIGDGEPQPWLPGQPFPPALRLHIQRGGPLDAWNAEFEQVIWHHVGRQHHFPAVGQAQWRDSMARAAAAGLPQSLARCGAALGLAEQKDAAGARLIRTLCVPRKPTKDDPSRWCDDPALLAQLSDYCRQDVRAERAISRALPPLSTSEQQLWTAHAAIVHRGIAADRPGILAAQRMIGLAETDYCQRVTAATGGLLAACDDGDSHDVGSHAKLREWLQARGTPLPSVDKAHVDAALLRKDLPEDVRTVLTARRALGRASTKKYQSMLDRMSSDNRLRGSLRFHGAHTGRWTGSGFQPQNLFKGDFSPAEVDACFADMATASLADFRYLWGDPLQAAAWCLRGALVAAPGHTLIAADYAGIEARVLLWLVNDEGARILAEGGDLYREMAAVIYDIPVAQVIKAQRALGKIAILGLGYGMGAPKFVESCAAWGVIISDELAQRAVSTYRARFPKIVAWWDDVNTAAMNAVRSPGTVTELLGGRIRFKLGADGHLRLRLLSGRILTYPYARIAERMTPWGEPRDAVTYMTEVHTSWLPDGTYGGKLVENIVQAVSRDIMAHAILACEANKVPFPVVLTVHDEIVSEVPQDRGTDAEVARFVGLLTRLPDWAAGCPITAEGYYAKRYRK